MVKYTCKSVEETDAHKTAHHFPPYHIGKRLEVERFRGVYRWWVRPTAVLYLSFFCLLYVPSCSQQSRSANCFCVRFI